MSSRRDLVGALSALVRLIDVSDSLSAIRAGSLLLNAREMVGRAERGLIEQTPWTPFEERGYQQPTAAQIKGFVKQHGVSEAEVRSLYDMEVLGRIYVNSRYQVQVREIDSKVVHLSIKRLDQQPIHDWRDLQRCKDELIGADCEAIELYPARDRVVDTSNQYHLWVIRDAAFRFPFGFDQGGVTNVADATAVGALQRAQ
jgi:hypothetical protein